MKMLMALASCLVLLLACNGQVRVSNIDSTSIPFEGISSVTPFAYYLTLRWTPKTGASYYVVYNVTSGIPQFIATVSATQSNYTVTGLSASTPYKFRVRVVDQYGLSDTNTNDVSVVTSTPSSTYSNTILADSPIAYWRMNERSGTTAQDSTTNGRTAAYAANASLAQAGPILSDPGSLSIYNSSTNSASVLGYQNTFFTTTTHLTLEIWHLSPISTNNGILFYIGDGAGRGYGLNYSGYLLKLLFGGLTFQALNSDYTVPANVWGHYVLTRDATTWKLYVNGAGPVATGTSNPNAILATDPIAIGGANGYFAEAVIYNSALTATQIQSHYSAAGY